MIYTRHCQKRARGELCKYIAIILFAFFSTARDKSIYDAWTGWSFHVSALQPSWKRISKTNPATTKNCRFDYPKTSTLSSPTPTDSDTMLLMGLGSKGKNENKNDVDESADISPVFWKDLGKKPGNLIFLPFIALFGIDLLLNIVFITKRSIEYFVLGQTPGTETWW